jgi:hypothetical protein
LRKSRHVRSRKFIREKFRAREINDYAEFCAAAFALIDKRIGSVSGVVEKIADVIEYRSYSRGRRIPSMFVTNPAVADPI